MAGRLVLLASVLLANAVLGACSDPIPRSPQEPPSVERPLLTLTRTQPVRVPQAALIERAGITGVYVRHGGRARFRMVKTGAVLGASQIEILSGLTGDEVVVLGNLTNLYDGQPVHGK